MASRKRKTTRGDGGNAIPRGKWVNAQVMVTSGGQIKAKIPASAVRNPKPKKKAKYKISVWHGEGKTLFYVIRNGSVVKTFTKRSDAESYVASKS